VSVAIRPVKTGGGVAAFGTACAGCPLVAQCTTSPAGRTITIRAYEPQLARARAAQADPASPRIRRAREYVRTTAAFPQSTRRDSPGGLSE
jgi:hypothetical protein